MDDRGRFGRCGNEPGSIRCTPTRLAPRRPTFIVPTSEGPAIHALIRSARALWRRQCGIINCLHQRLLPAVLCLNQARQQRSADQERQQRYRERLTLLTDENLELLDHDGLLGCAASMTKKRSAV